MRGESSQLDIQEVLCASMHRTDLFPASGAPLTNGSAISSRNGEGPRLTNVDRKLNDANNHYNTRRALTSFPQPLPVPSRRSHVTLQR